MENFDNIISDWKKQSIPEHKQNINKIIRKAINNIHLTYRLRYFTVIVLSLTLIGILWLYFLTSGTSALFSLGFGMMILTLILRIVVELKSISTIRNQNISMATLAYIQVLKKTYASRKRIHGFMTYALFSLYFVGYGCLLPSFYQAFSFVPFLWLIVSSILIFVLLLVFIIKMNRKELQTINESIQKLQSIESDLNNERSC